MHFMYHSRRCATFVKTSGNMIRWSVRRREQRVGISEVSISGAYDMFTGTDREWRLGSQSQNSPV